MKTVYESQNYVETSEDERQLYESQWHLIIIYHYYVVVGGIPLKFSSSLAPNNF